MQIILLERVEKLGQMGDVVKVKNGFARNYLLPQKKALRATKDNLVQFESMKVELEAQNLVRKNEAEDFSKRISGKIFNIVRQASNNDQLYGSVNARDIQVVLDEEGIKLNRSQIRLDLPIKKLGMHDVKIVLHPEVHTTIHMSVAKSTEEADMQHELLDASEEESKTAAAEAAPVVEETAEAASTDEDSKEEK